MTYGNCPECGWPMRLKATDGIQIFIECSNPDCINKWDEVVYEIKVTENV